MDLQQLAYKAFGFEPTEPATEEWQSHRPLVIRTATDLYSTPRRKPPFRNTAAVAALQQALWREFPTHQKDRYTETFRNTALVFLPGLLNFFPSDDFFNRSSLFFEHGGLIIGVAKNNSKVSTHGLYSIVGGDERVVQPNWRGELVLVLQRLLKALKDPALSASQAKKFVFVGHSKGGLLAQALLAIIESADTEHAGRTWTRLKQGFPGLDSVSYSDLEWLRNKLSQSQFYLYGSPIEGISRSGIVTAFDQLFLKGSAHHFTPEAIEGFFEDIGHTPHKAQAVIHAQKAPTLLSSLGLDSDHPTLLSGIVTRATRALFHGASHLIGATDGDGLVATPNTAHWPNLRFLPTPADHIQMVETPEAAAALLHLLDDHASADDAHPLNQQSITQGIRLVSVDPGLAQHLKWVLQNNPAKAEAIREGINGQLPKLVLAEDAAVWNQIQSLREAGNIDAANGAELVAALALDRGLSMTGLMPALNLSGIALH